LVKDGKAATLAVDAGAAMPAVDAGAVTLEVDAVTPALGAPKRFLKDQAPGICNTGNIYAHTKQPRKNHRFNLK
jgi:hypothetical protein